VKTITETAFMGCDEIRDLLAIVAGGEARDEDRIAVEEHVLHCASCAKELDLYREARANLASLREEEAPPGALKSIWTGVKGELFPKKPSRAMAWFDDALRYAAVVMAGLAIGVGAHVATRPAPVAPLAGGPDARSAPSAPIQNVGSGTPAPYRLEIETRPRFYAPRAKPDGNSYLPRVELIPVGGERDF
jgi:anti-sigma factor RsiW